MNLKLTEIVLILLLITSGLSLAGEVSVEARVDQSEGIYAGESFTLQVVIDGYDGPGEADLSPLAEYDPSDAGGMNASENFTSIINGKVTRRVTKRYVMNYSLKAPSEGLIRIPSIKVTVDGTEYHTDPFTVRTVKPGTTNQMTVEVSLSERSCFVGQPVVMKVDFYRFTEVADLNVDIPLFKNKDYFYFEDPDDIDQNAEEKNLGHGISGYINMFRVRKDGRQAVLLTFSKVLIPTQSGDIKIDPVSFSANIPV